MRIVIALGGNALEKKGLPPTAESQLTACKETMACIASLIESGNEVIITHGNGPQVGRILLATEGASAITPPMPFDVCGAMSQGYIGYQLQQAMGEELKRRGIDKTVVSVVTQVEVDAGDPGFTNPTKPIGPFYTREQADAITAEKGYTMKEDSGRGYRRVVASPLPKKIIELDAVTSLLSAGCVVIACGGGGVPVVADGKGYKGVAAVIDKDFASEKLAEGLDADMLVILTEVDKVFIHFNTPEQQPLDSITTAKAKEYITQRHFAPGSMLPKVQAAVLFADSKKGRAAIISSLAQAEAALEDKSGTKIIN